LDTGEARSDAAMEVVATHRAMRPIFPTAAAASSDG